MRKKIVEQLFLYLPTRKDSSDNTLNTLIIGGEENDPEIQVLRESFSLNITLAGIEAVEHPRYVFLDLNVPYISSEQLKGFDLIVCNQVLEHIYDVKNALDIISRICEEKTIVWLDFPVSTFEHGSPDFYTPGIRPEMISELSKIFSLKTLSLGIIGSQRDFLFGHLLNIWPTPGQQKYPILSYFGVAGSYLSKLRYQVSTLPQRILISLSSPAVNANPRYATTGWIILARENSKSSKEDLGQPSS